MNRLLNFDDLMNKFDNTFAANRIQDLENEVALLKQENQELKFNCETAGSKLGVSASQIQELNASLAELNAKLQQKGSFPKF